MKDNMNLILKTINHQINPYNPYELIEFDKVEGLELIWRYDGVYYKVASKLHKVVGSRVSLQTFRSIISKPSRYAEAYQLKIQPVFMKRISGSKYSLTTDGVLVSSEALVPLGYNLNHSYATITMDGESINFNRATQVLEAFMGVSPREIYWRNGLMGDCSLGNIVAKDFEKRDLLP